MIINKMAWRPFLDADGNGAAGGAGDPTGANGAPTDGGNSGENNGTGAGTPMGLDDFLKQNAAAQSDLDRRIRDAVTKATAKERDRQKIITDNMKDEMTRVSKMTEQERDAYYKAKAEKEAKEREADLTRRELTLDARAALQEKGLPDGFLALLSYTDKEACEKSIEVLDEAFRTAVQKAVDERLKGNTPPKDANTEGDGNSMTEIERLEKEARARLGIQ